MTYLGKNLRFLRQQKKLSLDTFAREVQIWEDSLRKIEQGKAEPDIQTLLHMAQFLELPLEHLLTRDLELQQARIAARKLKLILLDVDGTLTDGGLYYGDQGHQYKRFHVKDGMMIHRMITRHHMQFGFISGGSSEVIVADRAKTLGVQRVYVGKKPKLEVVAAWIAELDIKMENILYLGDDVNDLPVMERVGISACPADAPAVVKRAVHLILKTPGGQGCVRELLEDLLGYDIVQ